MRDFRDHAAHGGGVLQHRRAADLVELQADQGLALLGRTADGAARLDDGDFLRFSHGSVLPQPSVDSVSPPGRRACRTETLRLRRAATERGESSCFSASKVARTML